MGIAKNELIDDNHTDWDIDALIEEIWLELDGTVPRAAVSETICRLFAKYEDAPVKLFVPVVVRRKAIGILREGEDSGEI